MLTSDLDLPDRSKYALLALPVRFLQLRTPAVVSLGENLHVTTALPFPLPDYWEKWLGTFRATALSDANVFLLAHAPTDRPGILDQEIEDLKNRVARLYFGFLSAGIYIGHEEGMLLAGTHYDKETDVQQVQAYDEVPSPPGCSGAVIDEQYLRTACAIARAASTLEGTDEHSRVWRITRAFFAAVQSNEFGNRIHQSVRCIEGFVLPEISKTKKQMRHRTSLFLGAGHEQLIDLLFDIRSAVEHLHGPYGIVPGACEREKILNLAELSYKSEALARYCIQRLFTNSTLWNHFAADEALRAFWALPEPKRRHLWGDRMDVATIFRHFRQAGAAIRLNLA